MLQRALRAGLRAGYLLADAWFECKENIAACLENQLVGIFGMKHGLLGDWSGNSCARSSRLKSSGPRGRPDGC
jgi:hypothetical protein